MARDNETTFCPDCKKSRVITYCQAWNIRRGHSSGRCKRCRKGGNTRGLLKGRGWNKGLEGFGKWPKWYPKMEKNPAWKGGVTSAGTKLRNSPQYAGWRKSVFIRDSYTCVICGIVGGPLHADHIKPFSKFPELRLSLENGRTLCVPCHKKTPTYLVGARYGS